MNEFIPTKMINNSKRKLRWINKEIKSLFRKRNKLYKKMNQHRNTKTIQQYKDAKQRLQKETRRAYWNYLENIICYDENSEKYKNKTNSGIIYKTQRKTAQELHL
jgi:hypothetical protein